MTSLKTTIVVTVLLIVGYSVYQALYEAPAPKQPAADDASSRADASRRAGPGAADQYPASAASKQAARRPAGSRFATGLAPDRVAPRDELARANPSDRPGFDKSSLTDSMNGGEGSALSGRIEDPFRRGAERGDEPDRSAGRFLPRGSVRSLPPAASDPPEADSAKTPAPGVGRAAGVSSDAGRGRTGWNIRPGAVSAQGRTEKASGGAAGRDTASNPSPPASEVAPREENPAGRSALRDEVRPGFLAMIQRANRQIGEGHQADVLREMTDIFERSQLTPKESDTIVNMLDQLACAVVYSRQHLLEPACVVKPNETLYQIAQDHNVPWQLLAKINGVRDPNRLTPGQKLKVVSGPFDAKVYLERRELVLTVAGCYAGRFPVGVGRDLARAEGQYFVRRKQAQQAKGPAPADAARRYYIELNEGLALHGEPDAKSGRRAPGPDAIALSDRDLEDVFDMLVPESNASRGSRVTILR